MHSKGNVRYSVQSTNIEQRGKPRYLGMHVIENGERDKSGRTRSIVVSRHIREDLVPRHYRLSSDCVCFSNSFLLFAQIPFPFVNSHVLSRQ